MKLSIITINYNNRSGLQKTRDSVIVQSFRDFEWIVIDGGSTDGSKELIEQNPEHLSYWVSEPDTGIYNAMNKGIRQAHGEYLLFLNSGDSLCCDDIVESFCCGNFKEDIISGNIIVNDSIFDVRYSPDESEIDYLFMCNSTILHPSSFIKRSLFEKYGYYDESLKIVSDWKFFFQCLIQHSCSYRKWERCISSFNTMGISENPNNETLIKAERDKVISDVLPYVKRTYEEMRGRIDDLQEKLARPPHYQAELFLKRCFRKSSNILCSAYLSHRRFKTGMSSSAEGERLIVSMTSWAKRINNVPKVVDSILHNTLRPDIIVLNLARTEFPGMENDLPYDVQTLINDGLVEVLWSDRDTKAFKKFIPTLKKYPNDLVFAIDDDFIYPDDILETFMAEHSRTPNVPLSGNNFKVGGVSGHCGCASLVKSSYFGRYLDDLMDDTVLELRMDDIFYVFCAALNGVHYRYVGKLYYTNMRPISSPDGLSDENRDSSNELMRKYLVGKIISNYHINMEKINRPYFSL